MQLKAYDIVLLPESSALETFISVSENLKDLGTYFTLGEHEYVPHISLYMLQLRDDSLEKVCTVLEKITTHTNIQNPKVKEYHYEHDYLDIEYERSNELAVLQNKIISQLNPLRDGLREKDTARLRTAIGDERSNLLQFGYRSVGDLFFPHVTFTRFISNQKQILATLPKINTYSCTFPTLGIFEMGDNGTCRWCIKTWDLY